MTAWLVAALLLQSDYTLNGKRHAVRAGLADIPQGGRITIDARDRKVTDVADDISRQAGFRLQWDGEKGATVTLSAEGAPFVAVVAELARTMKCAFEEFQSDDGPFVQLPGTFVKDPVLAWHAEGPLVVTWHGLAARAKTQFDDPKKPAPESRYALRLWKDPRCHANLHVEKAPRERLVTFRVGDAAHELKSDHDPAVFSSSAPTWEFNPRTALKGTATIEIALPFHAPSRTTGATTAWEKGTKLTSGDVTITVESVKSERKKVRDPKDVFKQIEVMESTAVVKLRHVDGALYDTIVKGGRLTDEEGRRLAQLQEGGGALGLHEAKIEAGSTVVVAHVSAAAGVSSPLDGYRFEIRCRSQDLSFKPGRIALVWAGSYRKFDAAFRIEGAELK